MTRNIVLLCLDTVRQDYFAEHATRLQEMADVTYTQCRAASSWSVPSHASIFTGELPHRHGIHTYNRSFAGLSRDDTFLGDLPAHTTLGASANVWAGPSFGFDGLFDSFSSVSPDRRFPEGLDVGRFGQEHADLGTFRKQLAFLPVAARHDHPVKSLANGVLVQFDDWMARAPFPKLLDDGASIIVRESKRQVAKTEEPFFLFANLMDAHGPLHHVRGYDRSLHDAPLRWTSEDVDWDDVVADGNETEMERYRGLYGASIDYLDRVVASFVEHIQTITEKETTIVVTSDHGDNFASDADDGYWGHVESSLSEGLLHVPLLVINAPGNRQETVTDYVSHCRLGELLVGLAAGEVPDVTADRIAAERIGHSGSLAKIENLRGTDEDRMLRCVYAGTEKFLWDHLGGLERSELDLNRPNHQLAVDDDVPVEELESDVFDTPIVEYKEAVSSGVDGVEMDDATRERLSDLGYI